MHEPERLTIDVNIARDYLCAARLGHSHALELFQLAHDGLVELAGAPQGYRLDVRGDLSEQLRMMFEKEGVTEAPQVARVSEATYPSETLFPGAHDDRLVEAWDKVVATWRSHERTAPQPQDRWHVETHLMASRGVFLTSDQALLIMCQRLRAEHNVPVIAMSLAEYLASRS